MATHTFISILAWIVGIYCGLVVCVNLGTYVGLRANTKGWVILVLWVSSIWWLLCEH